MLFYVIGSLLFASALVLALAVIVANLTHYREQMMAALRTLSLDGIHAQPKPLAASTAFRAPSVRPMAARLRPAA
jgi:hypothetical protein